jgi:hypothetical protein
LFVSYRNYPATIRRGLERERVYVAGERAYRAGDYTAAEQNFRAALTAQPDFVDAQVGLALALMAQQRPDEAAAVVAEGGSRRADLVGGLLALRSGNAEAARSKLTRIEASAGESVQTWALEWLRPPPVTNLHLGDYTDLGYISGFSRPETAPDGSFRWLGETGRIVLPLPVPLPPEARITLRVAAGRPGETPLDIRIGNGVEMRVMMSGGQWRVLRLPIPQSLAGQQRIVVELHAPPFIPARLNSASDDLRVLSVRISDLRVE